MYNLCLLIFFILLIQETIMESFIILPQSAVIGPFLSLSLPTSSAYDDLLMWYLWELFDQAVQ